MYLNDTINNTWIVVKQSKIIFHIYVYMLWGKIWKEVFLEFRIPPCIGRDFLRL